MQRLLLVIILSTTMTTFSSQKTTLNNNRCISPPCAALTQHLKKHPDERFPHRDKVWNELIKLGKMPEKECQQLVHFFNIYQKTTTT